MSASALEGRVAVVTGAAGCTDLEADISDRPSVERMTESTAGELGGVDTLVNNAAIYPSRPWMEISEEEWGEMLAVNLKGHFLCARAAFPSMEEWGRGRIVNVASITFFTGFVRLLHYISSKGGVVYLMRSLAREVGPRDITVNAISPDAFPTDAEKIHPDPEGYNRWVFDQQSIKRRGTLEEAGNLVAFLASDSASFVTGQTIEIDGRWAMH